MTAQMYQVDVTCYVPCCEEKKKNILILVFDGITENISLLINSFSILFHINLSAAKSTFFSACIFVCTVAAKLITSEN